MIKLRRPSLPPDIDSDLSIAIIQGNTGSLLMDSEIPLKETYAFNGRHERTAKGDDMVVSASSSAKRHQIKFSLRRDSLYHILPEYLFHPLDRYSDTEGDKEEFLKRRKSQKEVESQALEYFYPFDRLYQQFRTDLQYKLNDEILNNFLFIVDFITEGYQINKSNPFIRKAYPCIIWLRNHRGVNKLLEVVIKYAFEGNLHSYMLLSEEQTSTIDPVTCHITLDGLIDNLFCGPDYFHQQQTIEVRYQTTIVSEAQIQQLKSSIKEFEEFFRSWFLTYNQSIRIEFGDYEKVPILNVATSDKDLFLGYNTQLI